MTVTVRSKAWPAPSRSAVHPIHIVSLFAAFVATDAVASTTAGALGAQTEIAARYDPVAQETQIRERVAGDLCVSFRLGREWTLSRSSELVTLRAASGEGLDMRLRSHEELRAFPQADVADRDAAALQQSYEALIGEPAQIVDHRSTDLPGVSRWSATWVDANIESADRALVVETFIVDLRGSAALELTLNAADGDAYRTAIARMLASLEIKSGAGCQDRPVAAR